jgi:hypothetical protein
LRRFQSVIVVLSGKLQFITHIGKIILSALYFVKEGNHKEIFQPRE